MKELFYEWRKFSEADDGKVVLRPPKYRSGKPRTAKYVKKDRTWGEWYDSLDPMVRVTLDILDPIGITDFPDAAEAWKNYLDWYMLDDDDPKKDPMVGADLFMQTVGLTILAVPFVDLIPAANTIKEFLPKMTKMLIAAIVSYKGLQKALETTGALGSGMPDIPPDEYGQIPFKNIKALPVKGKYGDKDYKKTFKEMQSDIKRLQDYVQELKKLAKDEEKLKKLERAQMNKRALERGKKLKQTPMGKTKIGGKYSGYN
jgi:hypothetical protein